MNRLRIPYLIGAAVDAFAAAALLTSAGSPLRAIAYPGVDATQGAFADGTRAAFGLMLGWTVLLIWAARRPIERRSILLLTAFLVVPGLMLGEVLDIAGGHASVPGTIPTLLLQSALSAIFVAGYIAAGRAGRLTDSVNGRQSTSS